MAVSIIAFLCSFSALSQQIQQLKLGESHKQIDVYSISEDQNGYLWLGTLDGLYRYDGKSFIGYHANASEPEHLSNNLARIVFTSSLGDLWIGTQRGLNRYIPDKDGFKQYLNADINSREMGEVIWGIFESPTQELLISTDVNLYRWDANADQLIPLLTPGSPATEIKSLVFTSERQVLAATYEQGLFFVELDTGQISPHPQNPHLKKEGLLLYQISAPHHNMRWLNTNKGSYQLSSETWQVSPEPMALANKAVRGMLQAGDETLWVGTEQGIFIQNRNEHYQLVKPQQGSEASPHIYVLYKDKYGNIWAGGRSFIGLHHASSDPFEHLPVNTAEEPQQANIVALESTAAGAWLLTQQGVLIFWDSVTEQLIELGKLPSETTLTASSRLSLSANKMNLWISTFNGLISYHLANKKLEKHLITINGVALEGNFDYQQDVHGQIWIASKNFGLLRYQPDSGQTLQFLPPLNELGKPHRLNTLTMNHKGDIWLGSEEGLLLFSAENKSFSQVNMGQSLWISSLAETDHGIWLGTLLNGLFFLDASTGTVTNYRSEDGLTDNGICDIIPLADHNTWVATNYGISYVAASSHKIRSFNRSSDIENVEFNQHAGSLSPTGTLYFGGTNGFTRFKPESIKPINYQGKVHLKTLRVFNQEVRPNGVHQRLTASIDSLRPIQLLHDDSPFSIEFGYPSPAHLETIAYSYRLVGQDHQWLTADSHSALATYTNISPGTYLFEVQAASKNDLWKSEITRVTIHVAPPLWQTVWAYVVYAALLACLLWFIRRYMGQRQQAQQRVIESEERLKLSLWGSGDELWDWQIDTGKIYRSNIWGLLEFPHDGRRSSQYGEQSNIHPKDLERVQKALNRHFDGDTTYYEATYRVRNKSSEWLWILDRGKIVSRDENNIPLRMTGTIKDISKLKQAEQRLTLFARSIANISDGVFILNRRFRIVEINDAFSVISGFTKSQIINRSLRFRSYPPQFTEQVKMKLAQQGRWVGELEDLRQDGSPFHLELAIDPITSEEGDVTHYVGVFSDITRRKQTENELHRLSVEDTLTRLPNRSWFQAEHAKLVAKNNHHALLVFDLDNFKKINDSLGHQAGDELLKQVASRLNSRTRQQDTLFRLGGDEYAVIMENTTDINAISQSVKSLLSALERPFTIAERELVVTSSIGIVLFPLDGTTPEELLRNADTAMYHAKSQGTNGHVFFSAQMNESAMHQLHIESLLRQAIRDDNFNLHYQPKFSSVTGEVEGMEALLRLHHPVHGPISPAEFIPLAEENGLIIEIGDIVLKKACFAAQKWRKQDLLKGRIAVNVSARQFVSAGFVRRIEHMLSLSGLPPHCLELELTEGALVDDPEGAIEVMQQIRQLGIHISLDDFGTGYSSLAYLQRFPIDTLKIDQSFVRNMTNSESGLNMVSSIIALAHNLHLTVIAEGVETEQERQLLSDLDCEILQGYLMSRPLNETDFSMFLFIQQNEQEEINASSDRIQD